MNVLKPHLQTTILTLLAAGKGQRETGRLTGIDRKTIRTYQRRLEAEQANSPGYRFSLRLHCVVTTCSMRCSAG